MLGRFRIDHGRPSWPTNIWITAMLRLFRPQIERLLRQRDAAVADISVGAQIAAVAAALRRAD